MTITDHHRRSRMSWFKTLGLFLGRALLDSRIIDVNLSKVFLKLILGKPVKKSIVTLKVKLCFSVDLYPLICCGSSLSICPWLARLNGYKCIRRREKRSKLSNLSVI